MRRSVPGLVCLFFLLGSSLLPALSRADFDRVVDFSITLKTLAAVADGSAPFPSGKMVVLSGTVSDVNIVNKDQASFKVRIELMTGEWIGQEDVKAYSCYVEFSGSDFFKTFPARAPAAGAPGVVTANSRVILVATPVEVTTTPLGEKHVLLQGVFIRKTE
jgi:hypothetical protein